VKYKKLSNLNIQLSEVGLGCASYWGKKQFSEKQAIQVVHQALDSGINYFDTGHSYSSGNAEIRLGKALANQNRSDLIISSKAGTRIGNFGRLYKDFSASWLRQSCELTLKLLNIEHLPIFFLHGPNPEDFNDETFLLIEHLKAEGKVGIVGVNTFDDHIIDLSVSSGHIQSVMLDYNLFVPHRLKTIQRLHSIGIDVIVAGGLGGGFVKKGFNRVTSFKQLWYWLRAMKNHREKLTKAKTFDYLNNQQIGSALQIALAFVIKEKVIASTLIGTTSCEHLRELIAAVDIELPESLLNKMIQDME
jgi:aryl-alcohol dehydrogenase-like predicted oxidoreductase